MMGLLQTFHPLVQFQIFARLGGFFRLVFHLVGLARGRVRVADAASLVDPGRGPFGAETSAVRPGQGQRGQGVRLFAGKKDDFVIRHFQLAPVLVGHPMQEGQVRFLALVHPSQGHRFPAVHDAKPGIAGHVFGHLFQGRSLPSPSFLLAGDGTFHGGRNPLHRDFVRFPGFQFHLVHLKGAAGQ